MKRILRCERGTSLVELALIMPVFLMLVLGVFDFGNGFNTYIGMSNAAREGALWITRFPNDRAGMVARINEEMAIVGLDAGDVVIIIEPDKPSYQDGEQLTLRLEHTYQVMFGAISKQAAFVMRTHATANVLNP
jgi:hypothetical protein